MNTINLGYFDGGSAGHCGYCDSQQSYTIGLVTAQLSPNIYKQMMDRGWRRCGTYYYKYQLQKCCCLAYTIREDVLLNQQKKSQRKIGKRFMQLLQHNGWQTPNLKIKEIINNFEKDSKQKQQIQPIKIEKQNIIIQQQQKVQQKQQQQIGEIKQQQELSLEVKAQLLTIFETFTIFLKENIKQFIECFKIYFDSKGFEIGNVHNVFLVEMDSKAIKIFNSNNNKKNKGDYYSNYIMMIYGLNKKNLFQDFSIEKFAMAAKQFIDNHLLDEKYQFIVENNGFLSIFEKQHLDQAIKHIQKNDQKMEKNKKKVIYNAEIQLKQQKIKEPIKLIDQANFKANLFKVGNMKIVLKKAECTEENFKLYQTYCKVIHKKEKESKQGYSGFLCEQGLKADFKKSTIDQQQLLFLGCYHMCYYLQDKLVAVGVVDITEQALSSVYFFYDPEFEDFNFGTFGALVEIEYIQLLSNYFPDFKYYYLGFYIQTTPKMLYKGDFEPAELLCPETYTWVALNKEMRQIIELRSKQQANIRKIRLNEPQIQCIPDMKGGDMTLYKEIQIEMTGRVMKLGNLQQQFIESIKKYLDCATGSLGRTLMEQLKFKL